MLGVVPITHYPTLVFSSESATQGTLHPGDYALLYPHWYQLTTQGSLQLVGKTAIPARQAPLTNVGCWADCTRLRAFEVQKTPTLEDRTSLEEQITQLKELTVINEDTTIILLEELPTHDTLRKAQLN